MTAAACCRDVAPHPRVAAEPLEKRLACFERWHKTRNPAWIDVSASIDAVRQAVEVPAA